MRLAHGDFGSAVAKHVGRIAWDLGVGVGTVIRLRRGRHHGCPRHRRGLRSRSFGGADGNGLPVLSGSGRESAAPRGAQEGT